MFMFPLKNLARKGLKCVRLNPDIKREVEWQYVGLDMISSPKNVSLLKT